MIIFNTTYHTAPQTKQALVEFLQKEYIPQALEGGFLQQPQLARVMADESEGSSIALQFEVKDEATLEEWYAVVGDSLNDKIGQQFGQNVAGFSTLLERIG